MSNCRPGTERQLTVDSYGNNCQPMCQSTAACSVETSKLVSCLGVPLPISVRCIHCKGNAWSWPVLMLILKVQIKKMWDFFFPFSLQPAWMVYSKGCIYFRTLMLCEFNQRAPFLWLAEILFDLPSITEAGKLWKGQGKSVYGIMGGKRLEEKIRSTSFCYSLFLIFLDTITIVTQQSL